MWDPIGRVPVSKKRKKSSLQNPNKIDFWSENIAGASQNSWWDQFIQQVKMSIIAFLKANIIICELSIMP